MKMRNILTCGVALAALTGVANAQNLDLQSGSVVYATENSGDAENSATFSASPSVGSPWPATPITLTLQIPNGAVTGIQVTSAVGTVAACWTGAGAGLTTAVAIAAGAAEIDIEGGDACSVTTPFGFIASYSLDNGDAGSVTMDVFNVNASTAIGSQQTEAFASWAARFSGVTVTGGSAEIDLPDFLTINGGAGDASVATVTLVDGNTNAVGTTGAAIANDGTITLDVDVSGGDFSGLEDVNGAVVTATSTSASFTLANGGAITFDPNDADPIAGGDYSVDVSTNGFDNEVTGSGSFTVDREGTDLIFPYAFDQATTAAFAGTIIAYRISNNGSSASGPVTLTLNSWDNAPTDADGNGSTTTCELVSDIAGGADHDFKPADLTACFGNFGTGDFTATVRLNANSITGQYAQVNSSGSTRHDVERR
jgi:hypothetical protein